MLNRHLITYLPVYLAQALVGFGGVVIFTRLLSPQEYGQYALLLAAATLAGTAIFTWLDAAVARFHARAHAHGRLPGHFSTVLRLFIVLAIATGLGLGALLLVLPIGAALKAAAGFALAQLIIRSALAVALVTRRAAGEAGRYSILESLTLAGGFALGIVFTAGGGLGPAGPFAGMAVAALVAAAIELPLMWRRSRRDRADRTRALTFFAYGAPVAFSLIFEHLLSVGDRFVIAGFLGDAATGAYAAGYGITDRSLDIIFIWLGAAAGPLAILALEREGAAAARKVLKQAAALMGLIGFPAALGLALVAEPLAGVLIDDALAARAAAIMPLIALGGLLNGLMTYFFHEAFILGRQPRTMALIMTGGALFNLALNLVLVPAMGLTGAALATVIAYGASLLACAIVGAEIFPLPLPVTDWAKSVLACTLMGLAVWSLPETGSALVELAMAVATGIAVYALAALALDIAHCRRMLPRPARLFAREARS